MTVETALPYRTAAAGRHPARPLDGVMGWRGDRMVATLGAFKMALVGSAAAVTLAAGGLTLGGALSVASAIMGVLVSAATLMLMARKWFRDQRAERHAGHRPPVRPPPLPLTRVTREDYARYLTLWERYTTDLETYYRKQLGGEL